MSAPKSHGVTKNVTTIAATIPHALMADLRRYCDVYRVSISQLVREGLELRLGHREDRPVDAPRHDIGTEVEQVGVQMTELEAWRQQHLNPALAHMDEQLLWLTEQSNSHRDTLESHTALFSQQGAILDDILTAQDALRGTYAEVLTRMRNASTFFVNLEMRMQGLEGEDLDQAQLEEFRRQGRAFFDAINKNVLMQEAQHLAQTERAATEGA